MKKSELLAKLNEFKTRLDEHKKLYRQSFRENVRDLHPFYNIEELEEQRKELTRQFYILNPYINKYSMGRIMVNRKTGREWDIYSEAIANSGAPLKVSCLDKAIMELEGIIAKVDAETKEEIEIIKAKDYSKLFEMMKLHPIIIKASSQRFQKDLYSDAIREAFKAVENYVKEKSGRDDFGVSLMSKVFSFEYDEKSKELKRLPILQLSKLKTKSERSEQKGFMYLFMGAMEGIRNPFAHERIEINDPIFTLKLLCLASFLLEVLDASLAKGIKKTK